MIKDKIQTRDKLRIVLTGSDGKVKDQREPEEPIKKTEVINVGTSIEGTNQDQG